MYVNLRCRWSTRRQLALCVFALLVSICGCSGTESAETGLEQGVAAGSPLPKPGENDHLFAMMSFGSGVESTFKAQVPNLGWVDLFSRTPQDPNMSLAHVYVSLTEMKSFRAYHDFFT